MAKFHPNPPTGAEAMAIAEQAFGRDLPADYAAFLKEKDGGEGFFGRNFIVLWNAEQLASLNADFGVKEKAPGLVLIGSDGGEIAFAFDARQIAPPVVRLPFKTLSLEAAETLAPNFTAFLHRLEAEEDLLTPN